MSERTHGDGLATTTTPRGVLILLTDELTEPDLIEELRGRLFDGPRRIVLVAPAVEETLIHHALSDVDTATRQARRRLESSLAELRRHGISALGKVGDSDPVVAAEDALREYPADEILIVAHADDQARWFEAGLFERAREALYPAVRMVTVRREEDGGKAHLDEIKESGPGRKPAASDEMGDVRRGPLRRGLRSVLRRGSSASGSRTPSR
jgi:hypothetical protein